jgi:hypothetical protein
MRKSSQGFVQPLQVYRSARHPDQSPEDRRIADRRARAVAARTPFICAPASGAKNMPCTKPAITGPPSSIVRPFRNVLQCPGTVISRPPIGKMPYFTVTTVTVLTLPVSIGFSPDNPSASKPSPGSWSWAGWRSAARKPRRNAKVQVSGGPESWSAPAFLPLVTRVWKGSSRKSVGYRSTGLAQRVLT